MCPCKVFVFFGTFGEEVLDVLLGPSDADLSVLRRAWMDQGEPGARRKSGPHPGEYDKPMFAQWLVAHHGFQSLDWEEC